LFAKQLSKYQIEQSKQKNLNIYFDNILDLEFSSFVVVLKYLDEVLVVQQNRSASLSISRFVFLSTISILSAFFFEQSIANFFDKLRNNKIDESNDNKLRKNISANINNLYCRERILFFEKNSINCRRRSKIDQTNFEIDNRFKIIDLYFDNFLQNNRQQFN